MADDGVITIENPYVRDLIDNLQFDTIYHEHHCYFSCTAVEALMRRHGLFLDDVTYFPICTAEHSGGLSVHGTADPRRREIPKQRSSLWTDRSRLLPEFASDVAKICDDLRTSWKT